MFLDPKFWLAVSFFIFLASVLKYLMPKILAALDNQSKQIANQIESAAKMKEQAEYLLLEAKKYHQESLIYCQKLIDNAKSEAEKLLSDSEKSLNEEITKRIDLAKEKIASQEEQTIREIKSGIINIAIKAIEGKIENLSSNIAKNISKNAIDDINKIVH